MTPSKMISFEVSSINNAFAGMEKNETKLWHLWYGH